MTFFSYSQLHFKPEPEKAEAIVKTIVSKTFTHKKVNAVCKIISGDATIKCV